MEDEMLDKTAEWANVIINFIVADLQVAKIDIMSNDAAARKAGVYLIKDASALMAKLTDLTNLLD